MISTLVNLHLIMDTSNLSGRLQVVEKGYLQVVRLVLALVRRAVQLVRLNLPAYKLSAFFVLSNRVAWRAKH